MALSWLPPLLVCCLGLLLLCSLAFASDDLEVLKIVRKIDLSSQTVRTHVTLTVKNVGQEPQDKILLGLPAGQGASLGLVRAAAIQGKKDDVLRSLEVGHAAAPPGGGAAGNVSFLSLKLLEPLPPGEVTKVEAYMVLSGQVAPFPAEIGQLDKQLLLFHDTHYVLVPYVVKDQMTTVSLPPGGKLESYTKKKPSKTPTQGVLLGPYRDVAPLTVSHLAVHYASDRPLLVATRLLREVEVSHWGNVYVTEHYTLRHDGAKHRGTFNRLDYETQQQRGANPVVRSIFVRLPPRIRSVYYRDSLGNISTSRVYFLPDRTDMELEPRYPILGGWGASFVLGYSLPLEDVVFRAAGGRRALNMTFGTPLVDVVVEDLVVKVVLPEGSRKVESFAEFAVERAAERKFTYLDVGGRPVVVLSRRNVVGDFAGLYYQVAYEFVSAAQLAEPLMLVAAFTALFAACAAYVRFDFAISKAGARKEE